MNSALPDNPADIGITGMMADGLGNHAPTGQPVAGLPRQKLGLAGPLVDPIWFADNSPKEAQKFSCTRLAEGYHIRDLNKLVLISIGMSEVSHDRETKRWGKGAPSLFMQDGDVVADAKHPLVNGKLAARVDMAQCLHRNTTQGGEVGLLVGSQFAHHPLALDVAEALWLNTADDRRGGEWEEHGVGGVRVHRIFGVPQRRVERVAILERPTVK